MTAKHHRKDPPFFAKFKNRILDLGGTVSDDFCDRGRPGERTRRLVINPPGTPSATGIFLHGTGNDLTYPAVSLYRQLVGSGLRLCAFDLDGHGRSGTSKLSAEGIADFVDWCMTQLPEPAGQPFIIGHSFGGTLALDYAVRQPQSVSGLILISAPVRLSADLKALAAEAASLARPAVWHELPVYGLWGLLPALGPFKRTSYPVRLTHQENSYVSTVDGIISGLRLTERAQSLAVPAMLIYGTGDLIVPPQNEQILAGALQAATSMVIPGATHFSTILEPGVPGAVAAFIRERATGDPL